MERLSDAEILFAEHRDGVFRYLCRIVGRADTARELTQEVFLRIARSERARASEPRERSGAEGLRERACKEVRRDEVPRTRAWIYRIARNLALNHLRDGRRRPDPVELTDASRGATQEVAAAVHEALERLSDLDRDVFLMRETAGLSYDEIAAACDLSIEAVRSRLHRVRQQLREDLSGPLRVQRERGIRLRRGNDDDRFS